MRLSCDSDVKMVWAQVGPMMSSGGGSIALCSSSIAHRGMANHDALAAAKGAVSGLALSAASTYSPHNIRVNVCVPGVVSRPFLFLVLLFFVPMPAGVGMFDV